MARHPTTRVQPGHGDKVTSGVIFRPVLTDALTTRPFPLSAAPILTLTPRRWFAPADGTTKVYFDITLRDANGAPLPGRAINLSSSIGTPTSGGITDQNGKTLAYLVSGTQGEANVRASLSAPAACENALSPKARVTFNPPLNVTALFPGSPASYFSDDISVTPQPVHVGITATIHAKLTNPFTVPITVDVSFGFAQSSIGLAFGPIVDVVDQVIPANSSVTLAASFMPLLSGHYCVQVSYNITAIGSARGLRPQVSGGGSQRLNLNAYPGPMGTPSGKETMAKADKAFKGVSKIPSGPTQIQKAIIGRGWDAGSRTSRQRSRKDWAAIHPARITTRRRCRSGMPGRGSTRGRCVNHARCRYERCQCCPGRCERVWHSGHRRTRSVWRRFRSQQSGMGRPASQCPDLLPGKMGEALLIYASDAGIFCASAHRRRRDRRSRSPSAT